MRVNARRGTYDLQQWSKLRQTAPDGRTTQSPQQQSQARHTLSRHHSERNMSASGGAPKVLARRQLNPGAGGAAGHSPVRTMRDAYRNESAYASYSPGNSGDSYDPRVPLDASFPKGRLTPEPQRMDSPSSHFRSNSNAAQQQAAQISALQQHIAGLEERLQEAAFEKEQMLAEKSHWIATLQDENNVLVNVLQDARKAKELFLQELDLLHRERMRVKHLNSDGLNNVQEFLASLPLATAAPHTIPVQLRSKARELHNELCNLVLEIKANQEQVMEFVSRQATFAEHALLTGSTETCHSYLNDVRDLASARPNNMTAAKEVLEHLPEAVLAAVVNLQPITEQSRGAGRGALHQAGTTPEDAAKSEAFLELEEELSRLSTQNSAFQDRIKELETTIEDLKKNGYRPPIDPNQINGVSTFDDLPDDVRSTAWRMLSSFVLDELNAHPLANAIPPEFVNEASKEIALQLRGLMAKLLVPIIATSSGRPNIDADVSDTLSTPTFQGELLSLVTLFMAYLFQTHSIAGWEAGSSGPGSRRPSYSRRPSRSGLSRENSSSTGFLTSRRPFS